MRSTILAMTLALAACGAWAQTDEDAHAAHHPNAAVTDAAAGSESAPLRGERPDFKAIEALMQRIQQSSDAGERRQLMREHLMALRAEVRAMRTAAGKPMGMMRAPGAQAGGETDPHAAHRQAGAGQDAGTGEMCDKMKKPAEGGGAKPGGMMGGGMMKMHQRMEQRLEAIERVLEQLIEREVVESDAR